MSTAAGRRALLLVPPARGVVIRDYYCSKTSQANYLHPPLDLTVQGGWLREHGWDVALVDATVDRLSPAQALAAVRAARPDVVLALAGAVSWADDGPFLARVAEGTGAPVYASGDLFMERPGRLLDEHGRLAGVLTDFTSDELVRHLAGESFERSQLVLAGDAPRERPRTRGRPELPVPAHDLFVAKPYRYAFARRRPMASVVFGYGCPYTCSFCIMGELGSAVRPAANVLAEIDSLRRLGVRELFVQDQCFGQPRAAYDELLDALIAARHGLGWWTFTRVDVLDAELALRMKAAGCHTVVLGVESASEEILSRHRKGYTAERVREGFVRAREAGLRTAATFILGLPEETPESLRATIDFARSLPADFASFNVAVPRAGTRLRQRAVDAGLVDEDVTVMDQSGFEPVLDTAGLSADDLRRWRRRAVAGFYLRPGYVLRRLLSLRTPAELAGQAREAWMLLRNLTLK